MLVKFSTRRLSRLHADAVCGVSITQSAAPKVMRDAESTNDAASFFIVMMITSIQVVLSLFLSFIRSIWRNVTPRLQKCGNLPIPLRPGAKARFKFQYSSPPIYFLLLIKHACVVFHYLFLDIVQHRDNSIGTSLYSRGPLAFGLRIINLLWPRKAVLYAVGRYDLWLVCHTVSCTKMYKWYRKKQCRHKFLYSHGYYPRPISLFPISFFYTFPWEKCHIFFEKEKMPLWVRSCA